MDKGTHFSLSNKYVFIFYCCHEKSSLTQWLKESKFSPLIFLQVKSLAWVSQGQAGLHSLLEVLKENQSPPHSKVCPHSLACRLFPSSKPAVLPLSDGPSIGALPSDHTGKWISFLRALRTRFGPPGESRPFSPSQSLYILKKNLLED